ncbi:MAG: PLDc N-terminal domain-containing protein [Bacteroidales bacterium]|nr:PLDc N-terminal domain-containing protein [Bacteroidales bacterium]
MEIDNKILMALVPMVLIQLTLIVFCLLDWRKRIHFKLLDKWVWLFVFLFLNLLGPILYLTLGRDHERD